MQVTPETVTDTFSDPDAAITVLMPPRDDARGLLYAHEQGDISDEDVRDVVLVHILAEKLTFQDLVALPEDTQVDTLLDGAPPYYAHALCCLAKLSVARRSLCYFPTAPFSHLASLNRARHATSYLPSDFAMITDFEQGNFVSLLVLGQSFFTTKNEEGTHGLTLAVTNWVRAENGHLGQSFESHESDIA